MNRNASVENQGLPWAPFGGAAIIWLALGLAVCRPSAGGQGWMLTLWFLCLADLFSMARMMGVVFRFASENAENRGPLAIQTLYWGAIKLGSLGLIGALLWKARPIPPSGLLMGLGTMLFVPLVGGFWWSQKAIRHA